MTNKASRQHTDTAWLATCLRRAAQAAYMATVGGGPNPQTGLFHDRMGDLRLGDLVIEISAYAREDSKDINAVGTLIGIADQANGLREYDIVTLDGRNVHWNNCQFVAFPTDRPLAYTDDSPE